MKEKLSLKSIKNVLSRAEMKVIMAGSGDTCTNACGGTSGDCAAGQKCTSQPCPGDPAFTHTVCVAS